MLFGDQTFIVYTALHLLLLCTSRVFAQQDFPTTRLDIQAYFEVFICLRPPLSTNFLFMNYPFWLHLRLNQFGRHGSFRGSRLLANQNVGIAHPPALSTRIS